MVQIVKRSIGTGGMLNITQKDLDEAELKVGDHVVLVPGEKEIVVKLRR